jgi:7-keto-8-aminopelargonate synthetase-like enzyme
MSKANIVLVEYKRIGLDLAICCVVYPFWQLSAYPCTSPGFYLIGRVAEAMLAKGVYVIGFSYPVVPQGKARIRTQISAAHSREDLADAIEKFGEVKAEMGI